MLTHIHTVLETKLVGHQSLGTLAQTHIYRVDSESYRIVIQNLIKFYFFSLLLVGFFVLAFTDPTATYMFLRSGRMATS